MKAKNQLPNILKHSFKTFLLIAVFLFFSKIFAYLYRIIIARYFGAEVYGLFSLAIVIIGWFVTFAALGFNEGIVRYVSFYRGKKEVNKIRYLFKFSSRILLISTSIIVLISFFSAEYISVNIFHNSDLTIFLKIFSVMIPFWIFALYFASIMRAFEKIKQQAFIESLIQNLAKLFGLIALIFLGFKVNSIIFSFFLGIFLMFLSTYFYCKYKIPQIFIRSKIDPKIKKDVSKNFVTYSWPVMFFGIISGIFYWVDSFTIGFFKSATEVGFYNAAIPIALLIGFAPELFMHLFLPLITREFSQKNMKLIKEISKQIGKWIFMFNLPLFLLMMFFPGAIINILFGPEYLVAENALRFLLVGAFVSSLFVISHNLISMAGKSKIIFYNILIATSINIFLNILLVPKPTIFGIDNSLGINGAAMATMISVIIFNLLFLFQAKHYLSIIPFRRKMFNVLLASLAPFLFLMFLRKSMEITLAGVILLSLFFYLAYICLLFFLKGFDVNDVVVLKDITKKIGLFEKDIKK